VSKLRWPLELDVSPNDLSMHGKLFLRQFCVAWRIFLVINFCRKTHPTCYVCHIKPTKFELSTS